MDSNYYFKYNSTKKEFVLYLIDNSLDFINLTGKIKLITKSSHNKICLCLIDVNDDEKLFFNNYYKDVKPANIEQPIII